MYRLPWGYRLSTARALIFNEKRSLHNDAISIFTGNSAQPRIQGIENIPSANKLIVTMNHYTAQGHNVLWSALLLSAIIPHELTWVMTNAWTFPGHPLRRPLRWISEQFFQRLASVYSLILTPPMPPRPEETNRRSTAIRKIMVFARSAESPWFGFAPEGQDFPGNVLGYPPSGGGRFLMELGRFGFVFLPVGIYYTDSQLHLNIGVPYRIQTLEVMAREMEDHLISEIVMSHIAMLLPEELRGEFQINSISEPTKIQNMQ